MAAPSKQARRQRATIVFIDESGFLLNPLVRRTLAPKGQTPILSVRGRHRQKVSVLAALTLSPKRRFGLLFRTLVDGYFQTPRVVAFLKDLLTHIRGKIIVVWDRWNVHKSAAKQVTSSRLRYVELPPYAPELNPVEHIWSRVKWGDLCNYAPEDAASMRKHLMPILRKKAFNQADLETFWQGAKLHIPRLKLLR